MIINKKLILAEDEEENLAKMPNNELIQPTQTRLATHHRLNNSSSPVLTATCLSYVTFLLVFLNRPGGHTPRPILTQNGSNDVVSRKDVPFGVKIATF